MYRRPSGVYQLLIFPEYFKFCLVRFRFHEVAYEIFYCVYVEIARVLNGVILKIYLIFWLTHGASLWRINRIANSYSRAWFKCDTVMTLTGCL